MTDESLDQSSESLETRARAFRELARSFERDGATLLAERALARAQAIEQQLQDVAARDRDGG